VKVLMVSGSYPPMRCGVGDYTRALADSLAARNDLELRVLSTAGAAQPDDPPWLRREMRNWRVGSLRPFLRLFAEFRPGVVHVQYPTQGYSVVLGPTLVPMMARARGAAVVQTWHEFPQPAWTRHGLSKLALAAAADALIYVRPDYPQRISGAVSRLLGRAPRHLLPNASVVPAARISAVDRGAIRDGLGCGSRGMVVFFGFAYPPKGVHHLFRIADPERHQLVILGDLVREDPYHARLLALAHEGAWRGKVSLPGFVAADRAARILAAADAAVFPFEDGGGSWNTSVQAATAQGTFTIVTSRGRSGYDAAENVYYAAPGDVPAMRSALTQYAGRRVAPAAHNDWAGIAARHAEIYRAVAGQRRAA
jgi:glycosyltransferase involved in cell wall biosynthesis